MSEAKHTSWNQNAYNLREIVDSDDKVVARCLDKGDAEFVVRACNTHDNLLKACRNLLLVVGQIPLDSPLISEAHTAAKHARATLVKHARAALAETTEELAGKKVSV